MTALVTRVVLEQFVLVQHLLVLSCPLQSESTFFQVVLYLQEGSAYIKCPDDQKLLYVQVWRPLRGPVQDSPLGLIDATTIAPDDVLPATAHLAGGMTHDVSYYSHNPDHRYLSCCLHACRSLHDFMLSVCNQLR